MRILSIILLTLSISIPSLAKIEIGELKSNPIFVIPFNVLRINQEMEAIEKWAVNSDSQEDKLNAIEKLAPSLADVPGCQMKGIDLVYKIALSGDDTVKEYALESFVASLDDVFNHSMFPPIAFAQSLKLGYIQQLQSQLSSSNL